jgi:hypothetical protein
MTADIVTESDFTRMVRTVLQRLKADVLKNTSLSVSVEYDDTAEDGLNIVALAKLPSLVITGPILAENRFYSVNQIREFDIPGSPNQLVNLQGPPLTQDLQFALTGAANTTTQMLNLLNAVSGFFNRNKWIAMPRDPETPDSETVQWELDFDTEVRTGLDGSDDIRAFTAGFVIRGFDVDEGVSVGLTRPVDETIIDVEKLNETHQ